MDVPRRAAAMIFPRVRGYVVLDELIALGNAGLAEAAQRYDPDRGAAFDTFAWYRVHGAIVDGVRKLTNLPRSAWAKLVALRAASEYLEHRAARDGGATARGTPPPSGKDALAAVADAMSAIRTVFVTSLEAARDAGFDAPDGAPRADDRLQANRLAARLRSAIETLPERERAIITKYYFEGKNLEQAGGELGLSKSWASRLHAQAVERLRTAIQDDG